MSLPEQWASQPAKARFVGIDCGVLQRSIPLLNIKGKM